MPRLPLLERDDLPEASTAIWDEIAATGRPAPMLRLLANCPAILEPYWRLGVAVNYQPELDAETVNLVSLRTCIVDASEYGWTQRVAKARRAGLSEERILAVGDWEHSELYSELERAALGYVDAVVSCSGLRDETFSRLVAYISPEAALGLTMLILYYVMNHRYLAVMDIPLDVPPTPWPSKLRPN